MEDRTVFERQRLAAGRGEILERLERWLETATLATFFVGRDADSDEGEMAGAKALEDLRAEIVALRTEVRTLSQDRS
jgi:hypothetical protein